MIERAVVLVSGGLDSATCLALALTRYDKDKVTAVSVMYGQKHSKELECARQICGYYGVKQYMLDLSSVFVHSNCSLLNKSDEAVPEGSYSEQQANTGSAIVSTYVPFRNGLMLSAVASLAMSVYPDDKITIYLGNHADDAAGGAYPDCTPTFTSYMAYAIEAGTCRHVSTYSPFVECTKGDIVRQGLALKVPYELTWSCYNGGERPCGKCGTCIDRAEAFAQNGVPDPALIHNT